MPKTYLTIERNYRPRWKGAVEGVREIMQNAIDAEVQYGARMTVDYYDGRCLRIENEGATLDREALLLGHSSKSGRSDLIGQFGDGLKIGVLALVRDGFSVKIRNGSEVWVASIERHDTFGADVLCFDISTGRKAENRVRVEIDGITPQQWAEVRERFLVLDTTKREQVKTSRGALLLDRTLKGKVFVKGIFVQYVENLEYGYDLTDATLDVDRQMVGSYDRDCEIRSVWNEALAARPDLFDRYWTMLDAQAADVEGVSKYTADYLSEDLRGKIAARFTERHGTDVVLVATMGESVDAGHLGKRGVLAPKSMAAILATTNVPTFDKVREALKSETCRAYGWSELSETEQTNLSRAAMLVSAVRPTFGMDALDVVDFRSDELMGLQSGDRVQVAKQALASRSVALSTLVHEVAHLVSGAADGDKRHVSEIERIWSEITEYVTNA